MLLPDAAGALDALTGSALYAGGGGAALVGVSAACPRPAARIPLAIEAAPKTRKHPNKIDPPFLKSTRPVSIMRPTLAKAIVATAVAALPQSAC